MVDILACVHGAVPPCLAAAWKRLVKLSVAPLGKGSFDCGCAPRPRSTTSAQDDRLEGFAKVLLLTLTGMLYTYRFWKSFDWSTL